MEKMIGIITVAIFVVVTMASCNLGSEMESEPNTLEKEQRLLNEYLTKLVTEGYDIDTTQMGIYYVMVKDSGTTEYPQPGDTLVIGYAGYLIDGSLLDNSDLYSDDGKIKFVLGVDSMIEGFNDGVQNINKGSVVQLIIPSDYAYGSTGTYDGTIPPYSTVIFVVQVFDIRSPVSG